MHLLMNDVSLATDDLLTQTLADRVRAVWESHKSVDAARLNSLLTHDYTAVHPDGTVYYGEICGRRSLDQKVPRLEVPLLSGHDFERTYLTSRKANSI